MRPLIVGAVALLFVFAQPAESGAQERPDLSGSWTLSETAGGPGAGTPQTGARMRGGGQGGMMMAAGLGPRVAIVQDEGTLTVVRETAAGELRSVYNLDGSESRNRVMMMGAGEVELVSRASWDGAVLVIVTPISMGDRTGESRMSLSLDGSGRMVVDTSRTGGGGEGMTSRAVYTPD